MEKKNALSSSLKDHSVSSRTSWQPKNPWQNSGYSCFNTHTCNHSSSDHDCPRGCSWPPRSYPCTYCKREFRSAQALGGHMNVHRRDRARLRQSPPLDQTSFYHDSNNNHSQDQDQDDASDYPILTLNPNPNFPTCPFLSPSSSSLGKTVSCFRSTMVKSKPLRIEELPPPPPPVSSARSLDQEIDLCRFRSTTTSNGSIMMGTDLQLGDSSTDDNTVDLELRLGRS